MMKLNFCSQPLSEIHRSLSGPLGESLLTRIDAEGLEALRARTKASLRTIRRVYGMPMGILLAMPTGLAILALFDRFVADALLPLPWFASIVALAAVSQTLMFLYARKHLAAQSLMPLLAPLSASPTACRNALELVSVYPDCADYRDEVIGNGRELIAADLEVMARIRRLELHRKTTEPCKMLHGIPA